MKLAFLSPFSSLPCRLPPRLPGRTIGSIPRKRPRTHQSVALTSCIASTLQSLNNPRIKAARSLLRRRYRELEGKILVEGHRLVLDALNADLPLDSLFYTESALERGSRTDALRVAISSCGRNATLVSDKVMESISDTVSPQGVVAILARPNRALPAKATLLLVCDGVQDPGNVGTLVRTAAAAGAHGVLLTAGCTDAWGLKALRSGMGAQFRVPIVANLSWTYTESLLTERGMSICVADGNGTTGYTDFDWTRPTALIVGSEANGPSTEALQAAKFTVNVPMANGVESLNAAVAGAVVLFEASRQRRIARK